MLVQYLSDVHLEFGPLDLKNPLGAKVLVLAGDVLVADDFDRNLPESFDPWSSGSIEGLGKRQEAAMRYRRFLITASENYEHVIVVAGNHEFYHGKWVKSLQILRDEYARYANIHFLENDCYRIEDVTFVGATLWTNMHRGDGLTMHAVADMMNDFKIIRNDDAGYTKLRPVHTIVRHRYSLDYIGKVMEGKSDEKFVVVTHHAPTFESVHPRYRGESLMNGAYASDLSEFILDRPQIRYWIHGHMHDACNYKVGDHTTVLCNPRGYFGSWEAQNYTNRYFNV